MSQIVVDSDVASYIFNWHSLAQKYAEALRVGFARLPLGPRPLHRWWREPMQPEMPMNHTCYLLFGLALMAVLLGIVEFPIRSETLATLSRERQWSFLVYAHLSNRILLIERGVAQPIETAKRGTSIFHHADPAISPNGSVVAFARGSDRPGVEEIVLYNAIRNEESVFLQWPGAIWSIAWSPERQLLAFVADKNVHGNASLFVVDITSHVVEDLTPEVKWVSDYSRPSWSPKGDHIAFERRFTRPGGAETHAIMIVDLATKGLREVADGWFPSWSPDEDKIAYINFKGSRCYEVNIRNNEHRLMSWSLRSLLLDEIIGPAVWAPSGNGAMFNITSGMIGDSRQIQYVDFTSGRTRRESFDPAFEVVGWLAHDGRDTTGPRANR